MKLFLDDSQECPEGFILCRTAEDAMREIKTGNVEFVSFGYDLGTELTGYDVALFIKKSVADESLCKILLCAPTP